MSPGIAGVTDVSYDYIIVGSGAGGGTLAARLAESGRTVLLLEAGGDPRAFSGGSPGNPSGNRLPDDYDVPAFHAFASENEAISWNFFVRHYGSDALQQRDEKYRKIHEGQYVDGVLYPRATGLGGCTAHNAMILVYPHNADWDAIAALTGDATWKASHMRGYFEKLEDCQHRFSDRLLGKIGVNPSRHGWSGWLQTEKALPKAALWDGALVRAILGSIRAAYLSVGIPIQRLKELLEGHGDPNDWRLVKDNAEGVRYTPLTTRNHARAAVRERILDVAARFPERLRIELNALATRVLFDDQNRAVGIEFLKGERLYRAQPRPAPTPGEVHIAHAAREVILCGGAFNSPQLLMLSGIGPRAHLESLNIPVRIDLPGVGKNLQDRYEVGVVHQMKFDAWEVLSGAKFTTADPQYQEWASSRTGVYATNGAVLAVLKRSFETRPLPDLCCFTVLGYFKGYYPGYSMEFASKPNYLTWTLLKAHTNNRAGEVTLRSADPRDTPHVNFRYFEEGDDSQSEDLQSVIAGIKFIRETTKALKQSGLIEEEEIPGNHVRTDAELGQFVRDNAWGHHASCTCAIGARDTGGVLTSDFKVHGTTGLRVVDASVFPRIPGFFIVSAVYMIGEKAADVILGETP